MRELIRMQQRITKLNDSHGRLLSLHPRFRRSLSYFVIIFIVLISVLFFYLYAPLQWSRTGSEFISYFGGSLAVIGLFTRLYDDRLKARWEILRYLQGTVRETFSRKEVEAAIQVLENNTAYIEVNGKQVRDI